MNKFFLVICFSLLFVFFDRIEIVQASQATFVCAPGSLGDYSPFQSVPTYDYDTDGFVRFHFVLDGSGWNYTNNVFYKYGTDCDFQGLGTYTYDSSGSIPVGVIHLMIKGTETSPGSGWYSFSATDEDTGEAVSLGGFPSVFTNPIASIGIIKTAGYYGYPGYREDGARTPAVPIFDATKIVAAKTPVLIVPGVLGTDLKKGDDLLWANKKMAVLSDSFMDPLQLTSDLKPLDSQVKSDQVIRDLSLDIGITQVHLFHYIDLLLSDFESQGYIEGDNIFTFPYDWRYGVSGVMPDGKTVAELLGEKIQEIRQKTGSDKVDVVAHSTGGLVVKVYVADHPTDHHIGKAVFVGVPNLGAPKAIKALVVGDNFGVFGLNSQEMKKISKNMPVVYDLLPTEEYYNQAGSFHHVVSAADKSEKDLNYSDSIQSLILRQYLNPQAYSNSKSLHTLAFDTMDLRKNGIDMYAIEGCKSGTFGKFTEKAIAGGGTFSFPKITTGDETVPLISASSLAVPYDNTFFVPKVKHSSLMSENGPRQKIVNILTGSSLDTGNKVLGYYLVYAEPSLCEIKGESFKLHSPVDIDITDQDGNHAGPVDGDIENNIPGADYEVWGEEKYVFVPKDENQTYSIKIQGTGSGTFTFEYESVTGDVVVKRQLFINIPVTPSLKGTIELTAEGPLLNLDKDGDGTVDEVAHASSVIEGKDLDDLLPPQSTSAVTGLTDTSGSYYAPVDIAITATDTESGLLGIKYNLDNMGWTDYATATPISVSSMGTHQIKYFATDKAGNNEAVQTAEFTIIEKEPDAAAGSGGASTPHIGGGIFTPAQGSTGGGGASATSTAASALPKPQVLGEQTIKLRHGEGELIKWPNDPTVFLIQGGSKRPFASDRRFWELGYSFSQVQLALPGDEDLFLGMEM